MKRPHPSTWVPSVFNPMRKDIAQKKGQMPKRASSVVNTSKGRNLTVPVNSVVEVCTMKEPGKPNRFPGAGGTVLRADHWWLRMVDPAPGAGAMLTVSGLPG